MAFTSAGTVTVPSLRRVVDGCRGTLVGTSVVAYLLAFGRWGSHVNVGFAQLYVTDMLLLGGLVAWWRAGGRPSMLRTAPWGLLAVLAIPAVAVIRFAAGGNYTTDAIRDLAPYVYAGVAVFALVPQPSGAAHRTLRVLRGALIVHLVLVTIALLAPSSVQNLPHVTPPGPESRMLSIRPDFASACFVVLAVSAAQRMLLMRKAGSASALRFSLELLLVGWSGAVTLKLGARSGLIALLIAVIFIGARLVPAFRSLRTIVRIGLSLVAIAMLVIVVPRVDAFTRLAQTVQAFGIGVDEGAIPPDATGTAYARLEAWRKTLRYTNDALPRQAVGVGFGANFLRDSGAEALLAGLNEDGTPFYSGVRAPHNFLLNTYARMGFVGLGVVLLAIGWILFMATSLLRRGWREFDVLLVWVFFAIVIVAMFGVVLESPFGAIPAFWAAGYILTRGVRTTVVIGTERATL